MAQRRRKPKPIAAKLAAGKGPTMPCHMVLDLASRTDLAALAIVFPQQYHARANLPTA
jgi:hypothetical protein